ncbi:hypothetical protein FNF28_07294 [Cafeteria roenbergensis]|uniref:Cadherin domain-containing protein n=1 Tax=Cafeteria roenbergensis TaxID=33653 RepID=A0A5A8CAH2_CAFRO|nr:hypothetical protein FNF28_07294 [Cafeteria roenbergensis]
MEYIYHDRSQCFACPSGTYSGQECSPGTYSPCSRGYYCPTGSSSAYASKCGSAKVYCPLGSEAPITVPTGKYSAPLGVDEAVRYEALPCPEGKACSGGVISDPIEFTSCPGGSAEREVVEGVTGAVAGAPLEARLKAGSSGSIQFSIVKQEWNTGCLHGSDANVFTVGATDGTLRLNARQVKFDTCELFHIVVRAANFKSTSDCSVSVRVVDINERPTAVCGDRSVEEKVPPGSPVGLPMMGSDPDKLQSLIWTIKSPSGTPFSIGPCDGQLRVRRSGSMLDSLRQNSYSLVLQLADDGEPSLSTSCTMTVTVRDVNEPPKLSAESYAFSIFENVPAGSQAGRLAATDIDSSAISFKWSKADSVNHFAIHPTSGAVTVAPGSSINFEARSRYTYEAQVVDDAGNSDTAAVVITVMDDADSPSINQPASISVPELASDGTPVGAPLTATDEDANDAMTWSVISSDVFEISASTGQLKVKPGGGSKLDFETSRSTQVSVQVTDSYGRSAFRTVPVAVTDVNEPPEVSDTARSVREDAAVGTAVGGAVSALDKDENSILSFSIVSGSRGAFSIEKGGGQIRVLDQLDFETVPTYNLVVRVTDNGSPSRHADAVVTVSVEDTAEPPRLAPQSVTVAESLAVGASILVLPVQDDDKSQTHTCEISKGAVGSMVTLKAAPGGSGLRLCELVVGNAGLDFDTVPSLTLTIDVTDSGTPPLRGTGTVSVTVTDVNEAPRIVDSAGARAVSIAATIGAPVGGAIAFEDQDAGQTHTWTIESTKAADDSLHPELFTIDNSGQLATGVEDLSAYFATKGLTAEDPVFSLKIKVTDSGSPALAATMDSIVQVVSGNKPPIVKAATLSINEDAKVGHELGKVVATDPDGDAVNNFTIISGNTGNAFGIDPATGMLWLATPIDYETRPSYSIAVQAQDDPEPKVVDGQTFTLVAFTSSATVTINLVDVNEEPALAGGEASVDELSAKGVKVGSPFMVADPDAGDKATFAITKGNTGSVFAVQAVQDSLGKWGGQIVVDRPALNFEVTESYNLELQATDTGGLKSAASVVVTVNDVNDPPTIATLQTLVLPENTPVGSDLPATGVLVSVTDEDLDQVSVRIKSGGEGLFKLSPSGQLSLAGALDYETKDRHVLTIEAQDVHQAASRRIGALDFEAAESHQLTVVCTDREGLSASATVSVKVTDVNEAPAIVTTSLDLPETEASGAAVGRIVIADQDASDTHSVTITSGNGPANAPHFVLYGSTLKLANAALDFEGESGATSFTLGIKVVDSGTPPLSASANVRVVVLDRNEPPVMLDQARSIEENSLTSAPVGAPLEASDPDQGQLLAFRIIAGNEDGKFKIDPCSGQIKVDEDKGLDFETKSSYTLTVQVQDDGAAEPGPARLTDTATVTISVIDVNEPPTLQDAAASIAENSAQGTPVGAAVTGTDPERSVLAYSIVGGNTGSAFAIDSASGQISVASSVALDFESVKAFTLRVRATDDGKPNGPALFGEADVVVSVLDVNEPPVFLAQQRSILENSAAGSAIGARLDASDPDADQTVSFELAGWPDAASFTVSSNGQEFDFESKTEYAVEVTASDDASPPMATTTSIVVKVLNQNEAPTMPDATVEIAESAGVGATVPGTASLATDPDAGDRLQYELVKQEPDRPIFRVLAADGSIEVKSALLDFETVPVHRVWVRVTDIDGLADEGVITIEVQDVNEPPTLLAQARAVDENAPGAPVGEPLIASDPDAADKGALTFSLLSGGAATQFAINSTSGQLSTAAGSALDHESAGLIVLSVQVEDTQGLTSTAQVSVTVRDVNEAPSMAEDTFEFKVAENAVMGTQIDFVSAADVDDGDVLTWSMRVVSTGTMAAAGAGDFAINPATGALTVAKDTGLATDPPGTRLSKYLPEGNVYTLQVTVTDDGTGLLQDTATVRVTVIENNDPPELEAEYSASVSENCAANTLALELQATEHDEKDRNKLTYAILDGNYADTFKLTTVVSTDGSSNKAELRVARPIVDFEDRTSYSLVVQVSDGFLKASTVVTVSVVDVNERPIIDAASLTMAVDENPASVGGVVGTVAARDVDADDLLTFAFFGDGNKAGHFAIDASTGAVSVASLDIDRETTSSYSIGVRVSDAGGLVDERQLSVLVNDVNDAPALADVVLQVPENLAPGAQVSSPLRVVDDDARDRHTFKMGRANCWASQASHDWQARIALSVMTPTDELYKAPTGFFYQLTVGALNNAHSTIEKCSPSCFQVASAPTPAALSTREFRSFWFSVSSQGLVTLGRGESEQLSEGLLVSFQDGADAAHGPALLPTRVGVAAASSALQFSSLCFDTAQSSAEGVFAVVEDGSVRITAASPDFEAQREFGFEVLVTDSGDPAKQAAGVVMVQVQDVNERVTWATSSCLPGSAQAFAACLTVAEITLPGSAAAVLQSVAGMATDPDTLAKQALTFSVALDGNSFEGAKLFDVAPSTGVLSVKQDGLNHEQAAEWTLVVTATDNGTPQLSASALVHVAVEDVNEAPSLAAVVRTVAENSATGEVLVGGPILGSDVDAGQWGELAYAITGGSGSSVFGIEPSSGSLRVLNGTAGDLNFESLEKSKYQLVVRATDGGGLTARATVTVDVTDVNEAPVLFDAVRSVRENTLAPGKVGAPVTGTDPDNAHPVLGVRQQLLYSIVGGDGVALFKVDPCSGQLEVRDEASLNFEAKPAYTLTLQARDDVQPTPLTATATVTISLVDANDAPLIVVPPGGYVLQVEELAPVGTVLVSASGLVDRISATDEDVASATADWARLRWSLKSGNSLGIFDIDAVTGQVSVADFGRMDFENKDMNAFSLVAQVCDSGAPALCAETPVRVEVLNSNEPPRLEDASRAVNENTLSEAKLVAGQQLGLDLVASDPRRPVGRGQAPLAH